MVGINSSIEIWTNYYNQLKYWDLSKKGGNRFKNWNLNKNVIINLNIEIWAKMWKSNQKIEIWTKGGNQEKNIDIWTSRLELIQILKFEQNGANRLRYWNLSKIVGID